MRLEMSPETQPGSAREEACKKRKKGSYKRGGGEEEVVSWVLLRMEMGVLGIVGIVGESMELDGTLPHGAGVR